MKKRIAITNLNKNDRGIKKKTFFKPTGEKIYKFPRSFSDGNVSSNILEFLSKFTKEFRNGCLKLKGKGLVRI